MNSPAPVNIATLRKLITLNPKQKNVCTVCHKKMRAPGADEEPTPTCDNCAQDIVVEVLPRLLSEIEAARAAKPAPKPPKPVAMKPARKKAVKAAKAKPAKKVELERPKRQKPNLHVVPKEPESQSKPLELTSEHEEELLDAIEQSKKPEIEESEADAATDVSELALALEEEKKDEPKPRRRIVKFVPAEPKEVQAAVVKLREKFEN